MPIKKKKSRKSTRALAADRQAILAEPDVREVFETLRAVQADRDKMDFNDERLLGRALAAFVAELRRLQRRGSGK